MKKKKQTAASNEVGRAVFVGCFMTIAICCFFLFSGIALKNTAENLHGNDTPLLEISTERTETPEITVRMLDTVYEFDLSGLNRVAELYQAHYPIFSRELRGVGYFVEELNRGLEFIRGRQEESESDGKIFCKKE